LLELAKYGELMVCGYPDGWVVWLEVFVTGEGVAFKVKSGRRLETPTEAATQCYTRLAVAMKKIKETV